MSQSVDDMSQNKIVTNRPSTKTNCNKLSTHFGTYRSFFCDISSMTKCDLCDKSSVTYVTSNLCHKQWTICLKKGAICLVQTNTNRHIHTQVDCRIVITIIYCNISNGRNKLLQTLHAIIASRDRLAT